MPNRKNAALIALLEHSTVAAAAEASGISQPTMFRYLQDAKFWEKYQEAKKSIVDAALTELQKATSDAVTVLTTIMRDDTVSPASRVNAAKSILSFAVQTTQVEDALRRIEILEERLL